MPQVIHLVLLLVDWQEGHQNTFCLSSWVVFWNKCNSNGLFDLAATAGLVTKSTYIHVEPK